jgi:glycosyltransferase involved in cell wall biosynthesis
MSRPRIAIAMRTRQRSRLLRRALESVAAQTFADWRLSLADQGDFEATEQLIREFGPEFAARVRHMPAPPGLSLGALLNLATDAVDSDFITTLDDDDTWHPRFLEVMEAALTHKPDPEFGGVACQSERVFESMDANGEITTLSRQPFPGFRRVRIQDLFSGPLFRVNAFMYERACREVIGPHDEDLPAGEDWEFHIRFICRYDIAVVRACLACHHTREQPGAAEPEIGSAAYLEGVYRDLRMVPQLNRRLRRYFAGQEDPVVLIQAFGQLEKAMNRRFGLLEKEIDRLQGKLAAMSEKVGKIDARTKELRDRSRKG